jgi:Tfp pilus assembly protein PilF
VIEAKNHFEIGCANLRNKQYEGALLAFVQASALDPDYPLLRDGMVSAFFHLGDRTTALVLAEALVCSRPREANSWLVLCDIARRCERSGARFSSGKAGVRSSP